MFVACLYVLTGVYFITCLSSTSWSFIVYSLHTFYPDVCVHDGSWITQPRSIKSRPFTVLCVYVLIFCTIKTIPYIHLQSRINASTMLFPTVETLSTCLEYLLPLDSLEVQKLSYPPTLQSHTVLNHRQSCSKKKYT